MFAKLKKKIKSNVNTFYIAKCIKGITDKEFKTTVVRMDQCDRVLNFKKFGDLNSDKNIYYIYNDSEVRGFFSLICLVLDALAIADKYSLVPVIEFGSNILYAEKKPVNGTTNPFEYYYLPVSNVTCADVKKSNSVVQYTDGHRNEDFNKQFHVVSQIVSDENKKDGYLNKRAELYKKYMRLNPVVSVYVFNNISQMLDDKRVLGIHVRGTDFNVGYANHAKVVTSDQYMEAVDEVFEKNKFDKIFLATDEAATIERFKEKYGDKLVYYSDIYRSEDGSAVHFSKSGRENNQYLLGLEVLRDMYTLAYCDGLIAGLSNVSIMAQIVKKSQDKEYEFLNIINNGFNTSGNVLKKG